MFMLGLDVFGCLRPVFAQYPMVSQQPDSKVTMLSNETSRKTSRISGRSSEANPKMKMGRSMVK